jgi:hypothetical protein
MKSHVSARKRDLETKKRAKRLAKEQRKRSVIIRVDFTR